MKLRSRQARRLSEFLLKLYSADSVEEFGHTVNDAITDLFPHEMIGYNERDNTTGRMFGIVSPEVGALGEVFLELSEQHPAINHIVSAGETSAVKVSDFVSLRQFRQLGIFHDFYRPLGIRYQLGFGCAVDATRTVFLALSRERRDFSEEERAMLNLLQPHIVQAWRRAKVLGELRERTTDRHDSNAQIAARIEELGLTPREAQVLFWVARGKTNEEIAIILGVSFFTVKTHLKHIFERLGVETRTAAAACAFELLQR